MKNTKLVMCIATLAYNVVATGVDDRGLQLLNKRVIAADGSETTRISPIFHYCSTYSCTECSVLNMHLQRVSEYNNLQKCCIKAKNSLAKQLLRERLEEIGGGPNIPYHELLTEDERLRLRQASTTLLKKLLDLQGVSFIDEEAEKIEVLFKGSEVSE